MTKSCTAYFSRLRLLQTVIVALMVLAVTDGWSQTLAPTITFSEEKIISGLATENSNPAAAYTRDGSTLYVVWDGLIAGHRRILLRERINNHWLETVIVDNNPSGNNSGPSISIDNIGTPHIAWIQQSDERKQPVYARRLSRFPNKWHYHQVPALADSTVKGNCDYVDIQLDEAQHPWLVWQYSYGSVYSIACSYYSDQGALVTTEITPGATGHNLEPKLFFSPEPTIYWYVAQSDQFFLLASKYTSAKNEWVLSPPDDLTNLPGDNLPELFAYSDVGLAAIWYEHATPQQSTPQADQVLLGIQNAETEGRGEVIHSESGTDYHSVTGKKWNQSFLTAWVSENYSSGSQVYAAFGNSPAQVSVNQVSQGSSLNDQPTVTTMDREATLAWQAANSGSSSYIVVRSLSKQ